MTQNSEYRVLARKYRPQSFADLVGQEPMVRTLTNAFASGRIAQAYMLTGVRGVGKTTTARILARALNFQSDDKNEPDIELAIEGQHCRAIIEGRHVDVIEMDAASHTGIDDIRDIIEASQYAPAIARYKVYIIDEVHMLSRSAFNGLLKTLEEPPAHLKFIFATTEIRKVPITVLSRCQRFDLRRIEAGDMVGHLSKIAKAENVEVEEEAFSLIARASEGSVRDGLSIFDQAIAHADGSIKAEGIRSMLGLADRARIIDLFEHVMHGKIADALGELQSQYEIGADPYVVLTDLADFIHFVTRLKFAGSKGPGSFAGNSAAFSEAEKKRGQEFADKLSVRILGRAWQILLKGLEEVRTSERALAAADMVLVRLTHGVDLPSHEELVKRLDKVESQKQPLGGQAGSASAISSSPQTQHSPALSQPASAPIAFNKNKDSKADGDAPIAIGQTLAQPKAEKSGDNENNPPLILQSFEALIFLAEDKRDLRTKLFLKRHVKLVEFQSGKLEFNLEGDPPRELLHYARQRIEQWTGMRWNFVISDKDGLPTLDEIEQAEKNDQIEKARSHPTVRAVLAAFSGSRIVDVRIKEASPEQSGQFEIPLNPDAELQEDTQDGLDDFFQ